MEPSPPPDAARNPRYVALLALAAAGILAVGSLLKPAKPSPQGVPAPSQTEIRRLQRLSQRNALETMASYFASVAADVGPGLLRLERFPLTAIVWSPELVVTAALGEPASEPMPLLETSGDRLASVPAATGPHLPLAAFALPSGTSLAPTRRAEADPATGDWIVAVWRDGDGHAFVPGHYEGLRNARCDALPTEEVATSLVLSARMAGGGIFDMDGLLLGVVAPCGDGWAVLSRASIAQNLALGASFEGQLLGRYGFAAGALDADLRAHLGAESGVLVREVWRGYPAAEVLRPGDVIRRLEGEPVVGPGDLQPLLQPGDHPRFLLEVRRSRATTRVSLPARVDPRPSSSPLPSGLLLEPPPGGYRIAVVHPGTPAAVAGIEPGDRLLRVDSVAVRDAPQATRLLSRRGGQPVFVEVERGARRWGALLR